MLSIENLVSGYGRLQVLKGVSLEVPANRIVALVGANGAGKTTLLRAVSGVQPVAQGRILFEGRAIEHTQAHLRVALGIAHVPEGREIFLPLSVQDNLRLGAYRRKDSAIAADMERICAMFPALGESRRRPAGGLSGGQQQMLAIGRALMSRPRLLLLDEPSMGLAPALVDQIMDALVALKRDGVTIVLVEQNAMAALSIADHGYVIETGRITHAGEGRVLLHEPKVRAAYLGV